MRAAEILPHFLEDTGANFSGHANFREIQNYF